jgi:hypothetical protein
VAANDGFTEIGKHGDFPGNGDLDVAGFLDGLWD